MQMFLITFLKVVSSYSYHTHDDKRFDTRRDWNKSAESFVSSTQPCPVKLTDLLW